MRQCARMRERGVRRMSAGLALVIASIVAGAGAVDAVEPVRTTAGAVAEPPALVIKDGELHVTLEEAIEVALRRNLDLSIQRYERTQSLLRVDQSKGIFDTLTSVSVSVTQETSPSATQLSGALVTQADDRSLKFTAEQLTPFGGVAGIDVIAARSSSNSGFVFLDPNYFGEAQLRITQPLVRGFGRLPTKRAILQARLASDVDRHVFEQRVTDTIQSVENAYWALVEAREQLVVAEESLALARELDQRNRVQVEVGTLAPIELVQSEATVATRLEGIIRAQAAVGDAADRLLQLLNLEQAEYWGLEIVPETEPETAKLAIDLDDAISTALAERPEIRAKKLDLEIVDIDQKYFKNRTLPQVDLTLRYNGQGIGGRGTLTDPVTGEETRLDTDLSDAFDDALGRDFDTWQIAVTASYPLQNRDARAQSTIADLEVEKALAQLAQLELQVVTEVRTAARAVNTAAEQIESARASRRLQERNLEAEQKRYENGMSTSFQVTQIQEDLTEARSRLVSATTTYRTALVAFYRAVGRLLEDAGVELMAAEDYSL